MPIYEYACPVHGTFEVLSSDCKPEYRCPDCRRKSKRIVSRIAQVKVIHTERPPWYARERVEDRQRLMKDTKVKKALKEYKDQAIETTTRIGGENVN